MEFNFNVAKVLRADEQGFCFLDGAKGNPYTSAGAQMSRSSMYFGQGSGPSSVAASLGEGEQLSMIIDNMGAASSKAQ